MRQKTGIVVSAKNDKTAVVLVHVRGMHPVLKKAFRISKKFHVHDPENSCSNGDEVLISETRPLSKLKRWRLEKILKKGQEKAIVQEEVLGDFKKEKPQKEDSPQAVEKPAIQENLQEQT